MYLEKELENKKYKFTGETHKYDPRLNRIVSLVGAIGSRNAYLTLSRTHAYTGCFSGTWDQLIEKIGDRPYTKQYVVAIELANAHFSIYAEN